MNIKSLFIVIALSSASCIGADAILDFTNGVNTSPVVTPTSTGARITFNSTTSTNLNALNVTNGATVGGEVVASAFAGDISRTTGNAWINANAVWGIKGDGVTDNTTELLTMRTWLRSNDNSRIIFTNGTYLYTNPFWLTGVKNVEVDGGFGLFRNTKTNIEHHFAGSISLAVNLDFFWNLGTGVGDELSGRLAEEEPCLINTVTNGSTNIVLQVSTNSSKFASNDWAYVYGWTGPSVSYPPNGKFSEFVRIRSSVGGEITIADPLKNYYDQRWYGEQGATHGAPAAILPLNRPRFHIAEKIVLRKMRFGFSPGIPQDDLSFLNQGAIMAMSSLEMVIEDCEMGNLGIGQNGTAKVMRSKIRFTEPDGSSERIEFDDCDLENIVTAGPKLVTVKNSRLYNRIELYSQNGTVVENCDFYGKNPSYPIHIMTTDATAMDQITIGNSRFHNPNAYIVHGGGTRSIFVDSSTQITNLLTTVLGSDGAGNNLMPGVTLTHVGGTNTGNVQNIVTNGSATNYIIEATFRRQPISGEEYRYSLVRSIEINNATMPGRLSNNIPYVVYPGAEKISIYPLTNDGSFVGNNNGSATNITFRIGPGSSSRGESVTMYGNMLFDGETNSIGYDGVLRPEYVRVKTGVVIGNTSTPNPYAYSLATLYGVKAGGNIATDGSFNGNGSGLTNIPASSIVGGTGSTNQTTSGFDDTFQGSVTVQSNLTVHGTLNATNLVLNTLTLDGPIEDTNGNPASVTFSNVTATGVIRGVAELTNAVVRQSLSVDGDVQVTNSLHDAQMTIDSDINSGGTIAGSALVASNAITASTFATANGTNFAVDSSGNGMLGNVKMTNGTVTAAGFVGNGSGLTNIPAAAITGLSTNGFPETTNSSINSTTGNGVFGGSAFTNQSMTSGGVGWDQLNGGRFVSGRFIHPSGRTHLTENPIGYAEYKGYSGHRFILSDDSVAFLIDTNAVVVSGSIYGNGGGVTNVPLTSASGVGLQLGAFTNGICGRIPIVISNVTYYLTLSTNVP